MDRLSLKAEERKILGKKVKNLRKDGKLPAHVFGKGIETEHVTIETAEFLKIFHQAGETGLIDLKIGVEKIRPVLVRQVQHDSSTDKPIHVDFYQVNLTQKVTVPVPLVRTGEDPESVKLGEAIVLQTMNEVQVEALPGDLVENIEVDITPLQNIDDAITLAQLNYDHNKLTVLAEPDTIVVKLAPAVSADTQQLLEEQAAEAAEATAEAIGEEGEKPAEAAEGEEAGIEGEVKPSEAAGAESKTENTEDKKE